MTFFHMAGAKNPRVTFIVINDAGHFVYREKPKPQVKEMFKRRQVLRRGLFSR